eukprot:6200354-Pleurochrysis_carterae.AAC.3
MPRSHNIAMVLRSEPALNLTGRTPPILRFETTIHRQLTVCNLQCTTTMQKFTMASYAAVFTF